MNIETKIGFDKIKSKLNGLVLGDLGRSKVDEIFFDFNKNSIETKLFCISEFKHIIKESEFPTSYYYDIREFLKNIGTDNTYLNLEEIILLWRSLMTIQEILSFFKNEENREKYPYLLEKSIKVNNYPSVIENIKRIVSKEGKMKDSASPELKRIRVEIKSKESQISGIVRRAMGEATKAGYLEDGASIVVRNGKILIPVLAGNKNRVQGVVQDYSATGRTVYIEPIKSVELNNQIRDLNFEEKREIVKILVEFTDSLRPYINELLLSYEFLAEIDFIRAKALLAIELNAEQPKISDKQIVSLRYAQHPLLLMSYQNSGKKVVPLDLEVDNNQRIILISGPNAGGKSIALKTVGLQQYMVQCGFLVPAKSNSKFGIFKKIFVDIGDDQSLESDLSTYSSHLMNMKNIVEKADEKSLILIDEFGSGTDPAMGGAIAEAILEEILKKNAKAVINTHYSNLKYFAAQNSGILNAAMLFDKENLRPLYLLEVGNPGSSFAFEIAKNIGLSENIIQRAKDKTGKKAVDFDKIISEIEVQSRKLRDEQNNLKRVKADLVAKTEIYRLEKEKLIKDKKKILAEASNEAKEILLNANKSIERTIHRIKKEKADNEKTKEIRRKFETTKTQLLNKIKNDETKISKEEKKLNKKKKKEKPENLEGKIKIGDFVITKKQGMKGKVEGIKDGMAMIIFGNTRTFVKLTELHKISNNQQNKQKIKVNIEMEKVKDNNFLFGIDLRGLRGDEAMIKIIKYIDNAVIAGASNLKILHGTGNGILRKLIRDYLQKQDYIEWYGDADIREGGQGITLVKLKN